jgi:hypothetical protein
MNRAVAVVLLFAAAASGQPWSLRDDAALRDSLASKGPLLGQRWLEKTGNRDYLFRQSWKPTEDSGLRCVGRWSYGPSLKVSLRVTPDDTVICLTRGSGASLIRFRSQDSVTLELLGDLNFAGMPRRAILADTLVVAGIHSGVTGLEVYGVSDPASPNLLSRIDLPVVNDIAVKDSLVYVACEDDSLRIYSVANPRSPVRVGACRDSCDLFMTQAGNYCYLVHVSGVTIVDVSNPASPHRAGHIGGGEPLAVYVRDTLCYVTVYQSGLHVYDIADPGTPLPLGTLAGDDALDITMAATCDSMVYTAVFDAINVADPAHPRLLGHADFPVGWAYGVAVAPALGHALVVDYFDGVAAVGITNPTSPHIDTTAFAGGLAVDLDVDQNRLFVASYYSGLSLLDVTEPSRPVRQGQLDYFSRMPTCRSVVADDSFAFVDWDSVPQLRSIDVSDPTRLVQAGGCDVWNHPEDAVLRDTLLFAAESRRFQVVNVAQPRAPAVVGSCVSTDGNYFGLAVQDTFAYEVSFNGMWIVNIARPDSPAVVSSNVGRNAAGIAVRDTFVYIPAAYDTLWVYSVANPALPTLLGSTPARHGGADIALADSVAVTGSATGLELFSLVDPAHPLRLGAVNTPYAVRRVVYSAPYFYVAMYDAGVAVYETAATGIAEPNAATSGSNTTTTVCPNPTRGFVAVNEFDLSATTVVVSDVTGRVVLHLALTRRSAVGQVVLDLRDLKTGVYFVELRKEGRDPNTIVRLIKL